MTSARGKRGIVLPSLFALAALIVLLALGTWQLERKAWKEALIETLTQRAAAPPITLPPRERWAQLDPAEMEFRRVMFPVEFLDQDALVYSAGSPLRPDAAGVGYWVFTPARLPGGSLVVVNRGFVPEGRQDERTRPESRLSGVVDVTGALRWPEPRGAFTPADEPGKNLWFVRDHLAMAGAKNWGAVAPFYLELEAPAPPGGLPRPGKVHPNLPNNHLQYVVTWYGLALVLVVVFVAFMRSRRPLSSDA